MVLAKRSKKKNFWFIKWLFRWMMQREWVMDKMVIVPENFFFSRISDFFLSHGYNVYLYLVWFDSWNHRTISLFKWTWRRKKNHPSLNPNILGNCAKLIFQTNSMPTKSFIENAVEDLVMETFREKLHFNRYLSSIPQTLERNSFERYFICKILFCASFIRQYIEF